MSADRTPLSNNLFAYCKNNPVRSIDPSGHFAFIPFLGAVAGGAIGGAAISTVSYIVGSALSGQMVSGSGMLNAAITGATSGAIGAAIGTISMATKAATVAAKGIASVGVGVIMGIKSGIEADGSSFKRIFTGVSTGVITAGATFLGSRIDAYDTAYGLVGNVFTNTAATLFLGVPAEIVSVASQQSISSLDSGMRRNNSSLPNNRIASTLA